MRHTYTRYIVVRAWIVGTRTFALAQVSRQFSPIHSQCEWFRNYKLDTEHFRTGSATHFTGVELISFVRPPMSDLHAVVLHHLGQMQLDPRAAEAGLDALQGTPGFALCLASILVDSAQPLPVRQLSGLILKRLVRSQWMRGIVPDAEKAAIRGALPTCLADRSGKIRTAVSMVVAAIAQHDFPDEWPGMVQELIQRLQSAASAGGEGSSEAAAGVLRCIELCAGELDQAQLIETLDVLSPLLAPVVASPTARPKDRARTVRVCSQLRGADGVFGTPP